MTDRLDKLIGVAEELESLCQDTEDLLERLDQLVPDIDDSDARANAEVVGGLLYDAVSKLWDLLSEINDAITELESEASEEESDG